MRAVFELINHIFAHQKGKMSERGKKQIKGATRRDSRGSGGWSNGPIGVGTYSWPLYAGAGQCNINNGTLVGNLQIVYVGSNVAVTYTTLNSGIHLNTTQLWVGNTILPLKKGKYITAPGQFPQKHENLGGVMTDTYTISGFTGNLYVAAHADVSWQKTFKMKN